MGGRLAPFFVEEWRFKKRRLALVSERI